jgi:hypothetical protein
MCVTAHLSVSSHPPFGGLAITVCKPPDLELLTLPHAQDFVPFTMNRKPSNMAPCEARQYHHSPLSQEMRKVACWLWVPER